MRALASHPDNLPQAEAAPALSRAFRPLKGPVRITARSLLLGTLGALTMGALAAAVAHAHGFGERYELPVPLWLYVGGAGAAVALSFAVIGLFVRGAPGTRDYPRINLLRWRAGRALVHPLFLVPVKLLAVLLFLLVIGAGLAGNSSSLDNIAPVLVWIIWWVGVAFFSALVGDIWALINPWKTIFEWADALYQKLNSSSEISSHLPYPERLGAWPGVVLFAVFAWVEIVYVDSAKPLNLAIMGIAYSVITWTGMLAFGKAQWLRHGECFSLVFGFLARFAPTEIRVQSTEPCESCWVDCADNDDRCVGCGECFAREVPERRQLNLRPFAVGLMRHEAVSISMMAFVVLVLATVSFDGFAATPAWFDIQDSLEDTLGGLTIVETLGLIAFPSILIAVYMAFSALTAAAGGRRVATLNLARLFVYSLVPIALAYHLAHFFAFLLIQGQLIIPLASDPFGFGWDLFGSADHRINIGIVGARIGWFVTVAAIVIGHIAAVYVAHVVALRTFKTRRPALMSQYPMLTLMVGYTVVSLWITAQPIIAI